MHIRETRPNVSYPTFIVFFSRIGRFINSLELKAFYLWFHKKRLLSSLTKMRDCLDKLETGKNFSHMNQRRQSNPHTAHQKIVLGWTLYDLAFFAVLKVAKKYALFIPNK